MRMYRYEAIITLGGSTTRVAVDADNMFEAKRILAALYPGSQIQSIREVR